MSFIDAHGFPAGLVLRVLDVPESTYYDWRARQVSPSRRELDDAALLEQIVKVRSVNEFAATYGSPRVWLELRRQGVRVGRKRGAAHARARTAGRAPAAGLAPRLDPAEPEPAGASSSISSRARHPVKIAQRYVTTSRSGCGCG